MLDAAGVVTLPEGSFWDWEVVHWTPAELRLRAGYDLTYHHELELIPAGATLVRCPDMFHDPVFRAPSAAEGAAVAGWLGESPSLLIAFDADGGRS
ncbi:hypothetical protein [Streptomyces sp. NPDC088923]|uniref:hypothetical protein n=1 Tax=Streptomyces sp. NPDC088923 TaxID=3365913 RepID=UPI0038275228